MVQFTASIAALACIGHAASRVVGAGTSLTARQGGSLPESFEWSSSGPLIAPKDDGRGVAGIKDPSVVLHEGAYHVFVSTATAEGYNLAYTTFADFADAGSAELFYLDQSAIGTGYRAAPQVFYFEPQSLWYLVFQDGNAAYSTNPDITDPAGWSAVENFYDAMPAIVEENIGDGNWVDMWVICDADNCHLFSSDDNGHLYRSQTAAGDFPNGMGEPVIDMTDDPDLLFEAANVYTVADGGGYLLIHEAVGAGGRWFRSWTATAISGPWESLADTEENPFASDQNVVFEGEAWTSAISHGEMVRSEVDQTLTVSPCNMQYLYQGVDPNASGDYNTLPWMLGLLTQTNSPC